MSSIKARHVLTYNCKSLDYTTNKMCVVSLNGVELYFGFDKARAKLLYDNLRKALAAKSPD